MKPTEKQLEFIETMQEFVGEQFKGTTKEEAQNYISRNIEEFELNSSSNWAMGNGYC